MNAQDANSTTQHWKKMFIVKWFYTNTLSFWYSRPCGLKNDTDTDVTLILASFSYLGKQKHHIFTIHSNCLCTHTYNRLNSTLLKYLYKIHCSNFIIFVSLKRHFTVKCQQMCVVNLWHTLCVLLIFLHAGTLLLHKSFSCMAVGLALL